jgi:hypothetical protein
MLNTHDTSGPNWLGDLAKAFLPLKESGNDGDCLGLGVLGITGVSCDMVSNFACQAPEPPAFQAFPSMRFVKNAMIKELANEAILEFFNSEIFNSLLPITEGDKGIQSNEE